MQIQISQIKNGYLVGTPPEPLSQVRASRMSQEEIQAAQQPIVTYAADYDEVCQALKQHFPIE